MFTIRRAAAVTLLAILAAINGLALAQNFPNKPIRIVTPPPGASNDLAARVIGQELSAKLGQQVVIDNRPNGVILGTMVSRAAPDGYTLLHYGNAFWLLPFMRDDVPYDPVRDFAPITQTGISPSIVVVTLGLPVKSIKELIAYAKARPKELNYVSSASGGASHIAAELFKAMANVDMVRVNYKAASTGLNDLIVGQAHLWFSPSGTVTPHIKSGKLRALAVTSAKPSALGPGLPTVAASGLPGYESGSIYGILAPARTPGAIVNLLNQEIVRVLDKPDIREKFLNFGLEAAPSSPQQFSATVRAEMARTGKLIKDLGIREE